MTSSAGAPYTLYLDLPPRQQASLDIEDEDGASAADADNAEKHLRRARVLKAAEILSTMYCPCVGYAFNAMTGDKTVIVRYLLWQLTTVQAYSRRNPCSQDGEAHGDDRRAHCCCRASRRRQHSACVTASRTKSSRVFLQVDFQHSSSRVESTSCPSLHCCLLYICDSFDDTMHSRHDMHDASRSYMHAPQHLHFATLGASGTK